jgi:hypothetical protein
VQVRVRTRAERGLRWTLAGLVLVCLGWKLYAVLAADPRLFRDSADYGIDVPFISRGFGTVSLVGTGPHHVLVRLPIVPLFFRALGRDARVIVVVQAVLGAASWGVLALVLARRCSSSLVGLGVGAAVLVFSMTATVAMWDAHLLSESLSISLLVLLIAASIRAFEQPSRARIAVAVVVAGVWVFTRDPNAYMIGGAAITVGFLVLVRSLPRPVFIVAAAWAVLAVVVLAVQSASPRWEALYDILGKRILTDSSATQEFARAGMPVTPQVLAMANRTSEMGFRTKPELAELRRWTRKHAGQTYLRYLLAHPDQTLLGPFRPSPCPSRRPPCLPITGDLDYYRAAHWQSAFPATFDKIVGHRFSVKQYLGAVAFCLVTGVLGLWRGRSRNYGWSISLSVASLVFVVLTWNASPREVFRHTLDMWIYVTLAVIISLGAIADEVIQIHKSRVGVSTVDVADSRTDSV